MKGVERGIGQKNGELGLRSLNAFGITGWLRAWIDTGPVRP